jgi:hypothetical protein
MLGLYLADIVFSTIELDHEKSCPYYSVIATALVSLA